MSLTVGRIGAAAVLTLDDGARRNVLRLEMCRAISAAVAAANADPGVKAIVITGAGPAFCAGADLDDLKAAAGGATDALDAVYQSFIDVADSALPTISAINGAAIGAGVNLALACDIRIASTAAHFDTRFLKIGLHPGGGHGWLLLRAVGWAEASRLLLFGHTVAAGEAAAIGLVQQVAEPDAMMDAVNVLTARTEALPRDLIIRTKASLRHAAAATHAEAFAHETAEQLRSLGEPPFRDLVARLQASIKAR